MLRHSHPFVTVSQLHVMRRAALIDRAMTSVHRILSRPDGDQPLRKAAEREHNRPPDELLVALRSPATGPRVVRVVCHGRRWRLDVTPSGSKSPDEEQRIWESVIAHTEPRGGAAA